MPIFSTLDADGSLECIRLIPAEALLACPPCILVASHYFDDDVCRCMDRTHYALTSAALMARWCVSSQLRARRPDAL
jgi:hypothetical protein